MAKLIHLRDVSRDSNSVITVGTFDGLHAGHRVLVQKVRQQAQKRDARSVIITFDPHPREIISAGSGGVKLLSTLEERRQILDELGIDVLLVIPFDRDFSLLSAEKFIRSIIHEHVGVGEFVIGYDHHFGKNREGTIETVRELGNELGFEACVVSRQEVGEHTVSSTAIRRAIGEEGDMQSAAEMLKRTYRLSGTVIHGQKRGKKIGYPTANLRPVEERKIIPKKGVYAVRVRDGDTRLKGMMNIGDRPTFEGAGHSLEVNIFDYDNDLYGKTLEIEFIQRVRNEVKFNGVDALVEQLQKDERESRKLLKE